MGDTPGAAPPVPETEGLFLIIGAEPHFMAGKKEGPELRLYFGYISKSGVKRAIHL